MAQLQAKGVVGEEDSEEDVDFEAESAPSDDDESEPTDAEDDVPKARAPVWPRRALTMFPLLPDTLA